MTPSRTSTCYVAFPFQFRGETLRLYWEQFRDFIVLFVCCCFFCPFVFVFSFFCNLLPYSIFPLHLSAFVLTVYYYSITIIIIVITIIFWGRQRSNSARPISVVALARETPRAGVYMARACTVDFTAPRTARHPPLSRSEQSAPAIRIQTPRIHTLEAGQRFRGFFYKIKG